MTVENDLMKVTLFAGLTPEQLKEVARAGRTQLLPANTMVFDEHDPADMLYVILDGTIRALRKDEHGREVDLARFKAGDFFGELSLIEGHLREARVTTISSCRFFLLSRTDFWNILSRSPWMLARILQGLSTKIRLRNEQYFELQLQKERLEVHAEIERHRSISQMVAGVAHEINTPLGIISNAASLICEKLNSKTIPNLAKDAGAESVLNDLSNAASLIHSHAARSAGLVESFKNLSLRNITGNKERVDFVALTEEALGLYRLQARKSHLQIEVVTELGKADRTWEGFPGHYTQVILNLLTNIDRYAYPEGRGGVVRVTVSQETYSSQEAYLRKPSHFRVVVQDFGCGIPKVDLPKVFDAFFTTGRALGGRGLGLAIVHNLVTSALQGTISISSEPGKGTRVEMHLPRIVKGD